MDIRVKPEYDEPEHGEGMGISINLQRMERLPA